MNIPFNLERAIAGSKVITREGTVVVEKLTYNPNARVGYELVGWIDGRIFTWGKEGNYSWGMTAHQLDLFMAPKKVKLWRRLYKINGTEVYKCIVRSARPVVPVNPQGRYLYTWITDWEEFEIEEPNNGE